MTHPLFPQPASDQVADLQPVFVGAEFYKYDVVSVEGPSGPVAPCEMAEREQRWYLVAITVSGLCDRGLLIAGRTHGQSQTIDRGYPLCRPPLRAPLHGLRLYPRLLKL